MAQVTEAERIVRLMLFVRENGPVSLESIRRALPYEYGQQAGSVQSTRRRFERDKRTLQEYGVYLTLDDQQRYALDRVLTHAAPLELSKPQVSLLRMLCGALIEDEDYPLAEELRMVLVKLGDELEIPDMLPQRDGEGSALKRADAYRGFPKVRQAISARKRLGFTYVNAAGRQSAREVEPFGAFFLDGACYVVAYDPHAGTERCFRLDRMSKLHVNAANPNSPDFEARPFDASRYYGLPFQFGTQDYEARIRLEGPAARKAEALTAGIGRLEDEDSALMWTVHVRDTSTLAQWCIENGPGIRILEPAEASCAYVEGLRAFLAGNGEGGAS